MDTPCRSRLEGEAEVDKMKIAKQKLEIRDWTHKADARFSGQVRRGLCPWRAARSHPLNATQSSSTIGVPCCSAATKDVRT